MRKPKRGTSSRETRRGNGVAASRWEPNPPPEPLARAAPGAACRVSRGCVPGADEFVGPRLRFSLTKLITSLPCRAARAGVGVGAPRSRPVRSHGCRRGHFPAVPSARVATSRPHACPGSGSSGCAAVADAVFLAGAWQMFGILAVFSKLNEFQSVLPPRPPCDSDDVWAGAHIGSRRAGAAQLLPRLPPSACDSRGSAQRPVHAACACACLADRGAVRGSTAAPADPSRTRPRACAGWAQEGVIGVGHPGGLTPQDVPEGELWKVRPCGDAAPDCSPGDPRVLCVAFLTALKLLDT